jgi:amidophosphoribosyltransferase
MRADFLRPRPGIGEREGPRECCGLFGVFGHPDAARKVFQGLFALQHRGQESAGIAAVAADGTIRTHLGMGLVAEVFDGGVLDALRSGVAIGHVRYSTTGGSHIRNAQPMVARCARGEIGVAHNGNLTNIRELRENLERQGSIFQSSADSEAILHLIARPSELGFEAHLLEVLRRIEGAFSLLFITRDAIVAARDPHGWRPLWIGRLPLPSVASLGGGRENSSPHLASLGGGPENASATVFASETCALEIAGATPVREVAPGEMIVVTARGLASHRIAPPGPCAHCLFEHIYFARPDSVIFGDAVHEVRKRLGRRLAEEQPADADVVIPVPDSGNLAALGFAEASGLPFDQGFVRSHYVGRTFMKPSPAERAEGVSMKLAVVRAAVEGKRVVVVDDSIVRGTTARSRVRLLRNAGAREVHLRISCPPIRFPCFFGIDFPDSRELFANNIAPDRMARELGATSLGFISLDGMLAAVTQPREHYCTACWSGDYPIAVPERAEKLAFEAAPRRGG